MSTTIFNNTSRIISIINIIKKFSDGNTTKIAFYEKKNVGTTTEIARYLLNNSENTHVMVSSEADKKKFLYMLTREATNQISHIELDNIKQNNVYTPSQKFPILQIGDLLIVDDYRPDGGTVLVKHNVQLTNSPIIEHVPEKTDDSKAILIVHHYGTLYK